MKCLLMMMGLRSHSRGSWYYAGRCNGQDDPENDVSEKAGSGEEYGKKPNHPHDRGIKVKIIGEAGAHTGNLFVGAGAHQFLLAARLRREAGRRRFRLLGASVVAKPGTNPDVLLTASA